MSRCGSETTFKVTNLDAKERKVLQDGARSENWEATGDDPDNNDRVSSYLCDSMTKRLCVEAYQERSGMDAASSRP